MNIELTGKTAVVTGSSAGIGLGTAVAFAKAGARVVITGRHGNKLDAAKRRILVSVPKADVQSHVADLATAAGCDSLIAKNPGCDILVNNLAKEWVPKTFLETPDAEWESAFATSIMPGVRCTRGYLQGMMDRGWGRVLFLSSVEAIVSTPDSLDYAFTRAAVLSMSRGLAKVAAGSGVTVNAVLPGPTMTEGLESVLRAMMPDRNDDLQAFGDAAIRERYPSSINGRIHRIEEVTNLIVYLCSESSSATTGAALRADGGILETLG